MTAQMYYKIQNTSILLRKQTIGMCQSHILGEKVISKVFLELTVQKHSYNLLFCFTKYYALPNTKDSQRWVAVEKNQDQNGK